MRLTRNSLIFLLLLFICFALILSKAEASREAAGDAKAVPVGRQAKPKDELSQKQEELNKVYRDLISHKRKLQETKKKEAEVMQKLFIIGRDLKKTKGQLGRAESQIQQNERRLGFLRTSLEDSQNRMNDRSGKLRERVREIYKNGGINYLQMLISSDTLADFINRTYFFEKILDRDVSLINDIIAEHTKIKKNKNELQGVTSDIKVLARFINTKKKNIEKQAEEKERLFKELEERRIDYERKVAVLEQNSKEIEVMIKKLLAERASKGLISPRGSGSFIWPVRGKLTSFFGYRRSPFSRRSNMHTGLDIAPSYGTPIQAADGGEVLFAGWWGGYGKAAIIDHGKGISTVYAHMSRIYVQKGQTIAKGQVVGLVGSTGYSTGPHLHFEVRKNGVPQNPQRWLP